MNQQTPWGTPWETYSRSVSARGLDMNIMHRVMADELGDSHVSPVSSHPAPKDALKKREENGKKWAVEGPTIIDVLVENQDVFSLICMLGAPNKKRLQASLALMMFAKENNALRNEIHLSGGIHSFLTMFRTRGRRRASAIV
jgi:hypothetical protein